MFRIFRALRLSLEAQHLAQVALDAAGLVIRLHPHQQFPWCLDAVTAILASMKTTTKDRSALERAAAGALVRLGK